MTMVRGVLRTKARLGLGSDVVSLEVSYWVVLMVQHLMKMIFFDYLIIAFDLF